MNTIRLTDQELETTRQGMTAFLLGFSHDEADTVAVIRSVLARLDAAEKEPSEAEQDATAAAG